MKISQTNPDDQSMLLTIIKICLGKKVQVISYSRTMHILVRIHNTVVLNNQKKIKLSKLTLGIHGDKADSRPCTVVHICPSGLDG